MHSKWQSLVMLMKCQPLAFHVRGLAQSRLLAERVPRGFRRKQMDTAVGCELSCGRVEWLVNARGTVSQLRLELQLVLAFEQICISCSFLELEAVWCWKRV